MTEDLSGSLRDSGIEALRLMEQALELIDGFDTAGTIAPQLDLAVCRLRQRLKLRRSEGRD